MEAVVGPCSLRPYIVLHTHLTAYAIGYCPVIFNAYTLILMLMVIPIPRIPDTAYH